MRVEVDVTFTLDVDEDDVPSAEDEAIERLLVGKVAA